MSGRIVTVRASALSDFLDCPARAEAKHLLGMRMPSNGKAALGTAVHKSTALYDGSELEGKGLTVEETAAAAVDAIRSPNEDVVWDEDESKDDAEKVALALHRKYCNEIAPKQDYAAVEVTCEKLEITDIGLALQGTTDRIRKTDDGYAISDIKTGKTAVAADGRVKVAGHTYQLGVYELLAERASGLAITGPAQIVGLNTAKTDKAQRVGTGEVHGAREVLVGDQDSPGILEAVAAMIHSGNFFGNPRSMLCHERYCPIHHRCKYRK